MYPTARPPAVDVDPARRPGIPMEQYPHAAPGTHWSTPEPQRAPVRVLRSASRREMPSVFGTGQPPKALSGALRGIAYQIPENRTRHWMLLLLADRVDVLEHRLARPRVWAVAGAGVIAAALVWRSRRSCRRRTRDGRTTHCLFKEARGSR